MFLARRSTASHGSRRRSRALGATLVVLAALGLAGCSAQGADDGLTVLRIGDPGNQGVLAYAKKTGVLDDALEEVGARIEWGGTYASFTATIDAVRSGDVNVLQGAISPAVGYLSTSDDLAIFSVAPRNTDPEAPATDGLVVPADSTVTTIQQLVGRKIAVNQGGRGEYLLNLALDDAGIGHDEVEKVYLNPDEAAGAFASGKVDAWWAIVRGYPLAVANGAQTILTNHDVADNDLTIFAARKEVVEENPEALQVLQEVVADLATQANAEPDKFQNVFTDAGPTATEGALLEHDTELLRFQRPWAPLTDADVATVQAVADYFLANEMISEPVDAAEAVARLES